MTHFPESLYFLLPRQKPMPMRILVVEDEKKVARFIQQGLEEEHYTVDVAHDGERGELLALGQKYDLLMLDVMLPEKNGIGADPDLAPAEEDDPDPDAHRQDHRPRTRWPGWTAGRTTT